MGYPFFDNEPYDAYRGNPLYLPIEVGTLADPGNPDSLFTGTDLTLLGSIFSASLSLVDNSDQFTSLTVDTTNAATGRLILGLVPASTLLLIEPEYLFDVQVEGGTLSPLTIFRGRLHMTGKIFKGDE